MTNSYKKEYPFVGYAGFGGGAGALSYKSAASKKYIDDMFSTYLYVGNDANRSITNGIDLSGEGGMIWFKNRTDNDEFDLFDTERGHTKRIRSDEDGVEATMNAANDLTSFNSDGFSLGPAGSSKTNWPSKDIVSWSFRKSKGFFDVVKYTGNGSSQNISHSLDCNPGCIIVKNRDNNNHWAVYHRSMNPSATLAADNGKSYKLKLDDYTLRDTELSAWNNTAPTSSVFSVGSLDDTNGSGHELVAYLFGGGVSTDAKNVSVGAGDSTNGSSNDGYMRIPNHSDINLDGDFTIEMFIKKRDGLHDYLFTIGDSATATGFQIYYSGSSLYFYGGISSATYFSLNKTVDDYDWHHICATRSGTDLKFYHDGVLVKTQTGCSASYSGDIVTGENYGTGADGTGTPSRSATNISNFRITKGQVLYTGTRFKVPDKPLTTTSQGATASNVKLLCFQSSTITEATVSPTTIVHENALGDVTATASAGPFDGGMIFGENEEDQVVKCGRYKGTGSAGLEVICGFEPQWVLIKNTTRATTNWALFDTMRGIVSDGDDYVLAPNYKGADSNPVNFLDITPTGFTIETTSHDDTNQNGDIYIYVAIRRPDGYVGKPPEAGTDVFAMDMGASTTTTPNFDSGFPVDMALVKKWSNTEDWYLCDRLMQGKFVQPSNTGSEGGAASFNFDSNLGWSSEASWGADHISHMWKRYAGFDVVTDKGDGQTTKTIAHSLGVVPQMIWRKNRDGSSDNWQVYHMGLNGGTNPHLYRLYLDTNNMEMNDAYTWVNAPTATHFTVGSNGAINRNNEHFVTVLFASVDGISKVGYYDGSNSSQTITTGFQPRYCFMKKVDTSQGWVVLDTLRGWAAGDDERLEFHNDSAQNNSIDFGAPTSTGFTLLGNVEKSNQSGGRYIYYAHA